ncbi:hypothetical protein NX794_33085 [Streptomyces sp. LP11]|uniref:Uncharacterized protein n=1 Tax=Streptomyces pyxinicus TaxID=2970331 RepID=A0ABT2BBX9_9ACTN|nr:hypothetical protein [Streptomyces sp. LP11]MCS0606007.1 hypothetical protein [Streptomyces sp. LP11]
MEWIDTVRELAEDPLVRTGAGVLVRGLGVLVRRVRRGRGSAAAHSEVVPAIPAEATEEMGTPMTSATKTSGEQLAEDLLANVGNEAMQAATRFLGAHRDGYWLRRFEEDQELTAAAGGPLIDRDGRHPSVDWGAVGRLLNLTGSPVTRSSHSELLVLEFAASMVGECPIQLRSMIAVFDDSEFTAALRALRAARGDED